MSNRDYISVDICIGNKKETVKMQKGCSFENNGAIYRMNNDGLLSVFDKSNQTWAGRPSITMTNYQFDIFKAVANNKAEKGESGIVLSKADIDLALDLHKNKKLTNDLSEFVNNGYGVKDVASYSNNNAFSAYVTNGDAAKSAKLIFKYGEAKDATFLSAEIASKKAEKSQNSQSVSKTKKPEANKGAKNTSGKKYYDRSNTPLPKYITTKLNTVIKKMGITEKEFNQKVKKTATDTGYSEYFIKYIVAMESFEPKVRNTGDGTLTGGFGHSKLRDKTLALGQRVTSDKAFAWLRDDIKFFEKKLKELKIDKETNETIGDYYNKLPLSLKEAMIDVAFNRDHRKLQNAKEYEALRANIKNGEGYLPACAVRLRQDFSKYTYSQKLKRKFTAGLMERNCYRFILAIRDFDDEYRSKAKQRFENTDHYYSETIKLKKAKGYPLDAKELEKAWNAM